MEEKINEVLNADVKTDANMNVVERIKSVLSQIRPYLNSDGGDLEFIKYEDGLVYIKLIGACGSCPYKNETIKNGILQSLQSEIEEIKDVINVEL